MFLILMKETINKEKIKKLIRSINYKAKSRLFIFFKIQSDSVMTADLIFGTYGFTSSSLSLSITVTSV